MVINFVSSSGAREVYHRHPGTYEFHQILDGNGVYLHGKKRIVLKPGILDISPPDYPHGFSLPDNGHISFYFIQFPEEYFERWVDKNCLAAYFSPTILSNSGITNRFFFEDIIRRNASSEPLLKKTAEYLSLSFIYDRVLKVKHSRANQSDPVIEAALKILHEHTDRPLSSRELSEKIGYDESYLSRLFKKKIGLPPMKYLTKIRMESAQYLLAKCPLTVRAIAQQSGYDDEFHFSKTFKKFTGQAPSMYRESLHS